MHWAYILEANESLVIFHLSYVISHLRGERGFKWKMTNGKSQTILTIKTLRATRFNSRDPQGRIG
jgi:hypothetical protein